MKEELENIINDIRDGIINTDFGNLNSDDKYTVYSEIIEMYEPEDNCETVDELFVLKNLTKFILSYRNYLKVYYNELIEKENLKMENLKKENPKLSKNIFPIYAVVNNPSFGLCVFVENKKVYNPMLQKVEELEELEFSLWVDKTEGGKTSKYGWIFEKNFETKESLFEYINNKWGDIKEL